MIKGTLIIFLLLNILSIDLFSQKNVVKIDLFGTLITKATTDMAMPKISYERAFGNHLSGQISIENGKYLKTESGNLNYTTEVYNVKGFGIMPELRVYLSAKKRVSPMGWFISTHYRYFAITENYFEEPIKVKTKGNVNNFGFNIGFKHRMGDIVCGEYLLGFGFSSGSWKNPSNRTNIPTDYDIVDLKKFATLRFEINLGFRFPKVK